MSRTLHSFTRNATLLFLLAFGVTPGAFATGTGRSESSRLRFAHLTVGDGLPANWVMSILKDSYGFVWFGTHQGLTRYDGTNLTTYRSDPKDPRSLPAPFIGMLYEDREKHLWAGFAWANAGIARYDRECDCFQRFSTREGFRDVRAMVQDKRGRYWVGTEDGVSLFDPAKDSATLYPMSTTLKPAPRGPIVNALLEDRAGRIWVGSDVGLFRFDPESGHYERWPNATTGDTQALGNAAVWSLLEDADGTLWAATIGAGLQHAYPETGAVQRYLPDSENPDSITSARVRGLAQDAEGRIYSGTENDGLNVLDPRTGVFAHYRPVLDDAGSMTSWSTWRLLIDDEGTLWAATHAGGVNWSARAGSQFHTVTAQQGGLSAPYVFSLLEDQQKNLWIGTDGGGLNKLDRTNHRFTFYQHDPKNPGTIGSNSVRVLLEREGDLWLGGWDAGLGLLDVRTGRVTRFRHDPADPASIPSNHVWSARETRSGELLVGTSGGTVRFDPRRRTFKSLTDDFPDLGQGTAHAMAEDAHGGLWLCGHSFAGMSTLAYLDAARHAVRHYGSNTNHSDSGAPGVCLCAHVDSRENVWVGTEGALYRLDQGAADFQRWAPLPDMANDEVSNILEDELGNLWVSVGSKLVRIIDAVRLPARPRMDVFDARDGFHGPANFGAAFRSPGGEMFLGGIEGVTSFFPRDVQNNPRPPRAVLTDVKVLNHSLRPCVAGSPLHRSITLTDSLVLDHDASVITFSFAALNFSQPEKNLYSYKLDGFDRDWSDAGPRHEATYTNLSPGQYVFRVRAANNDGVWSEQGSAFQMRITPPFWATWWFRLMILTAIIGSAVHVHRERVLRLTLEARALGAKMEERTRLARELHDTLEQALAGIRFQLSVAARTLRDAPPSAAASLEMARRMVSYCMEETRRAVMDLRSQALEAGSLANALEIQARQLSGAIAIDVRVAGPERRLDAGTEHHLLRIAQEALTNAVKHSGGSRILVDLAYHENGMTLTIEDDGRGLVSPTDDVSHFGLEGMRERAERFGGTLAVDTVPGAGVRVRVDVPGTPGSEAYS